MSILTTENTYDLEIDEQQLCQKCGLCCNGTLFGFVRLVDEDIKHIQAHIPDVISQDTNKSFKQPCRYYRGKSCSIYGSWRPQACSIYLCNVLIRYRQKKLSFAEAVDVIEQTVAQAEQVRKKLSTVAGDHEKALPKLFDEFVASHPNPDQTIMLEYGVVLCRLKRDFRTNDDIQDSAGDMYAKKK